ncbi:MAG: hypothetical protein JRJ86_13575 [Deltaproteobacteria bacterium]|nr:hypothetical protein [Deltaproteobacteria bacterium]
MTHGEIARCFNDTRAFIQGNPGLSYPHAEGWFRTSRHVRNGSEQAKNPVKYLIEEAARS